MNKMMELMEEYRGLEDELQRLCIKVADLNAQITDIRNRKSQIRLQWMRHLDGMKE